jgi:hypothetical protein
MAAAIWDGAVTTTSRSRRILGGRSLSLVGWLFTGTFLTDTVTAFKMFRRAEIAALPLETGGFELDHELTARMLARGKTIAEVPISYFPRSREEGKKIGPRDWFIAVRTFWRIAGVVGDSGRGSGIGIGSGSGGSESCCSLRSCSFRFRRKITHR